MSPPTLQDAAREIVGYWDALDAVPSSAAAEPYKDMMDQRIAELRAALEAAPPDGFCENHQPNASRRYAACWVCSRLEESAKVRIAADLFAAMPTLPSLPLGMMKPWREWLNRAHQWEQESLR